MKGPRSIDFDKAGNLWLATREGNHVFKFDLKAGLIHHIAGTGKSGFTSHGGTGKKGNGTSTDPLKCELSRPHGIYADPDAHIYIGDSESHKIRVLHHK